MCIFTIGVGDLGLSREGTDMDGQDGEDRVRDGFVKRCLEDDIFLCNALLTLAFRVN